jgi:hypothetical protein
LLPVVKLETCTEEELERYLRDLNKIRISLIEEIDDPLLREDDKDYVYQMAEASALKHEYDQEIARVIRHLTATRIKGMKKHAKP